LPNSFCRVASLMLVPQQFASPHIACMNKINVEEDVSLS
jgi:hypothetical protein